VAWKRSARKSRIVTGAAGGLRAPGQGSSERSGAWRGRYPSDGVKALETEIGLDRVSRCRSIFRSRAARSSSSGGGSLGGLTSGTTGAGMGQAAGSLTRTVHEEFEWRRGSISSRHSERCVLPRKAAARSPQAGWGALST